MEATGKTAADAHARGEDVVEMAASPAAGKAQKAALNETATVETKTETDRESVGSSDSARGQEREEGAAAGNEQEEAHNDAAVTAASGAEESGNAAPATEQADASSMEEKKSESKPTAASSTSPTVGKGKVAVKKLANTAKKTPAAKMPSKAKVVSARKTFDVIHAKRLAREPTLAERAKTKSDKAQALLKKTPAKTAPGVNKTLSFSAVKVRGERSTTLKAFEKKTDEAKPKPSRARFHYTPYKGPLPPFSNSLFAPKEVQALERLEHRDEKPKAAALAPKKPFLIKSTGKAGGVIGRATSGTGKENAHVNTPTPGADKSRRRLAETDKKTKAVAAPGGGTRVSVKDKTTLSFQAKVRMDRRATISSAGKAKATQARQVARQSTPAHARPTASKTTTTG